MERIMSTINNALSELAKKESKVAIEAAEVPKVKTRSPWIWVAAGFSLSLAMGGWAVSQGPSIESDSVALSHSVNDEVASKGSASSAVISDSPTKRLVVTETQSTPAQVQNTAKTSTLSAKPAVTTNKPAPIKTVNTQAEKAPQKPVLLASKQTAKPESSQQVTQSTTPAPDTSSTVENTSSDIVIKQVELTPEQLAANAIGRAKKALDANNLNGALQGFTEALRYTPRDEEVRQKLAILYFGKGDTRRAYELLQAGIRLNNDSEALRLGLSKLLVKADQAEAALSPLLHLPNNASKEYLAMRAALSQKSQQETIALESYQKLTELEQDNARWWLGLAIQQERQLMFDQAKQSYQNALVRVGISSQSQSFIRDRLKVISDLEGTKNAD
ncbi:tetratricopeptide repeat protein (plasmid) [Vibrio fortis]